MLPDFVRKLKRYHQKKGLTQEPLAAQVWVRRETIMRLEKAQYNPSFKWAIDISRGVEAPITEIFPFDETEERPLGRRFKTALRGRCCAGN